LISVPSHSLSSQIHATSAQHHHSPIVIVSSAPAGFTGAAIIIETVCDAAAFVFVFVVFDFVVFVLLDTPLLGFVVEATLVDTTTLVLLVITGIALLALLLLNVGVALDPVALAHCPHHGPLI